MLKSSQDRNNIIINSLRSLKGQKGYPNKKAKNSFQNYSVTLRTSTIFFTKFLSNDQFSYYKAKITPKFEPCTSLTDLFGPFKFTLRRLWYLKSCLVALYYLIWFSNRIFIIRNKIILSKFPHSENLLVCNTLCVTMTYNVMYALHDNCTALPYVLFVPEVRVSSVFTFLCFTIC